MITAVMAVMLAVVGYDEVSSMKWNNFGTLSVNTENVKPKDM